MARKYPEQSRKIAQTVRRYQIRHPEIIDGKKFAGRVALAKRAELNRALTDIFLEKGLSEIVNRDIEPKKKSDNIMAYALREAEGDKKKAREFLKEHEYAISEHTGNAIFLFASRPYFKRIAEKEGGNYASTSAHMTGHLSTVMLMLSDARLRIKD